jgi:hypothetical protein
VLQICKEATFKIRIILSLKPNLEKRTKLLSAFVARVGVVVVGQLASDPNPVPVKPAGVPLKIIHLPSTTAFIPLCPSI